MSELKDVQARLLWSRNTAEKLVTEAKQHLYEIVRNSVDGWEKDACRMAATIEVYESVMEETWPIVSGGGIGEEPPNKTPREYDYE